MVKQLIEANIILLLSSRIVRNFHTVSWVSQPWELIRRQEEVDFISFDVGQIIVDNGYIAQTHTQI